MVLIAVLGCVYVAWRKKRGGTTEQVMQSKKCNPDDLERADHQADVERSQSEAHVPSNWASGFESAEPTVSRDSVAVELAATPTETEHLELPAAPNKTEHLEAKVWKM